MRIASSKIGGFALAIVCALLALCLVACGNAEKQAAKGDFDSGASATQAGSTGNLASASSSVQAGSTNETDAVSDAEPFSLDDVEPYAGKPSVEVNDNVPYFTNEDRVRGAFETYSPLDALGRCGPAFALVGKETMPTGERGSIGMIKPSGWRISKYSWIDGKYLYNRCHLIAYALSAENDNERNLITGTRTMNAVGMLPYEEETARYIDRTGNHVLYRVTPVFENDNLIASGVLMEAESIEDAGKGIRFCVWCYNVEPGVVIDYSTGDNYQDVSKSVTVDAGDTGIGETGSDDVPPSVVPVGDSAAAASTDTGDPQDEPTYILNTNSHKFHRPECSSVDDMAEKNKEYFYGTRDEARQRGFEPCKRCNP